MKLYNTGYHLLFHRHHLPFRVRTHQMVVHRFDVDRGQVEAAGVDGAEVDFDCHLSSGGKVVDVAVGTVVADILVVDAGRFRVGRTIT